MKKKVLLGIAIVIVAIQLVPVNRSNPAVEGMIEAPPQIMAILEKSCYDCHSNHTEWPWYSYVAPVSWLIANDVEHGRGHLNFTAWDTYDQRRRNHKIEEIWQEVSEGEMPLWFYLPLHPEARLSAEEVESLRVWTKQVKAEARMSEEGEAHDAEMKHSESDSH